MNISYVALTLKSSSCVHVFYLNLGEQVVVSNDCVTNTMRYSTWSAKIYLSRANTPPPQLKILTVPSRVRRGETTMKEMMMLGTKQSC